MENLIAFFNRFSPLSAEITALMGQLFTRDELRKGENFIDEGQVAREIAFLETGIVRAYYINRQGKEYNQYFFVAPAIIGAYSSLISKQPARIPQQALTDCVIWRAPFSVIEQLSESNCEIERMRRAIAEDFFVKFEKKQVEMALLDASERYLIFQQEYPGVEAQIPQYHIAAYLGISATQLSRIKRKAYEDQRGSLPM